jgi:ribosomal protein L11 methyltransferase
MRWVEIKIETSEAAEDAVANALMEAGCGGVAIAGSSAFAQKEAETAGLITVTGYLPLDDSFEQRLEEARKRIDGLEEFGLDTGPGELTVRPVDEEDWATAWKEFFKPFPVGKFVVKPSWEEYPAKEGEVILELDPGMAFGTGTHPTTQLCLLALQDYVHGGESVLDLGCGSGILSTAAAKLGARRVVAIDVDPIATDAAQKNIRAQGLADTVEVRLGDKPVDERFDVVVANIIADTIIRLAEQIKAALVPGGTAITSGIIVDRENDVRTKLESLGMETLEAKHSGEWVAFVSRRPADG